MDWPNTFRAGRLIPAVEYVQASRVRMMLIEALEEAWGEVDVVVAPSFADDIILATNLTGHPSVTVPSGYRRNGTPTSITFLGGLWKDAEVLTVAKAYQEGDRPSQAKAATLFLTTDGLARFPNPAALRGAPRRCPGAAGCAAAGRAGTVGPIRGFPLSLVR